MIVRKMAGLLLAFLITISPVIIIGCTPAKKIQPPNRQNDVRPYSPDNPGATAGDRNMINNKLSAAVNGIANVNRATVVILGTSAYAGLELKSTLKGDQVQTAKKKTASVIKLTEPRIRSIWVTTNKTAIKRLGRIRSEMAANKPSSEYSRDLRLVLDESELVEE